MERCLTTGRGTLVSLRAQDSKAEPEWCTQNDEYFLGTSRSRDCACENCRSRGKSGLSTPILRLYSDSIWYTFLPPPRLPKFYPSYPSKPSWLSHSQNPTSHSPDFEHTLGGRTPDFRVCPWLWVTCAQRSGVSTSQRTPITQTPHFYLLIF